jgi:PAS domain S-box-containing protein
VSYLGTALIDASGVVIGHLAVLDRKPMPEDPMAVSIFELFAARAAAELRRLLAEREIRSREEEMALMVETAMDAILVFDREGLIVRINPAAERLLACTAEDLLGEKLSDFLPEDGEKRVAAFLQDLADRPTGRQHLWVPGDFVVRRWDHSVFPAEITLSRFERGGQAFHTLILRNCDEKLEAERRIERLHRESELLKEAVQDLPGFGELLGRSAPMRALFNEVKQVAATDTTVLITGETGTGKELVARSIYQHSNRSERPFVVINCAALPANLIESECFGHERGAFTGATSRREGRFSAADRGTIFLDEIGELPLELQAKLLRVLQEGTFEPLGGSRTVKVDVRVIAATHRDLLRMVGDGKFREDLYFRLNVFPVHVPPLRERGGDLSYLASALCEKLSRRMGRKLAPLSQEDLAQLAAHPWPGNVRELQNVIERAIILSSGGKPSIGRAMIGPVPSPVPAPSSDRILTAAEWLDLERANLLRALDASNGKISGNGGAAERLGVPPSTFSSRMKALGIERKSR